MFVVALYRIRNERTNIHLNLIPMKTFEHNDNTYSIQNGLLYRKDGNIWAYTVYTNDGDLRTKALVNGWKGNISDNLIDDGFHSYKRKNG